MAMNWNWKVAGKNALSSLLVGLLVAMGLVFLAYILVLLGVIQTNEFSARIFDSFLGLGQLVTAALLFVVAATQLRIQRDEAERSSAVVKVEQVPVVTLGEMPAAAVAGIEIWNEGRQATQIRDIRLEHEDGGGPVPLRFVRFGSRIDVPRGIVEEDFEPVGKVLESGELWQVKMTYATTDAIMVHTKPTLVIVPVLGKPCKVALKDPIWLDDHRGGPRF